jgi:RND family efflux transporter MFP subunit
VLFENKTLQRSLLLALAGLIILLLLTRPQPATVLQTQTILPVRTTTVTTHELDPVETVSGTLEPMRKAQLHFELNGQVRERHVEPGQAVAAGAALLALDAGDYQDALDSAESRLELEVRSIARDRELLELAQRNRMLQEGEVRRLEQLGKDSLVSRSLLDEARGKLLGLESEVARLRTSVATADTRLALLRAERNRAARDLVRTRLDAPFAGIVNAVSAQVGDYVTSSAAVVELVDVSALDLYVEVRGELARALSQGQQVGVTVDGRQHAGRIVGLQIDPDPVTFTHALRVRLTGEGLRPGMVAQAELPLGRLAGVLAVPVTAVLQDEGRSYVFRVREGALQRVAVGTGRRVGDLRVVQDGLQAGDVIVTRDVAALSDGQQVQVPDDGEPL